MKEDSLSYIDENLNLDLEKLCEDLADRNCVEYLAILKHQNHIPNLAYCDWPSQICYEKNYIEAITKDEITDKDIEIIRIMKTEYLEKIDLLLQYYKAELSEIEKLRFTIFS